MRRQLTPTADAKTRIQELGEKAIVEFIGEIKNLPSLVQHLPTVPGFRKKSKAGIERQKQELARRLSSRSMGKSGPQDKDYHDFYTIWRAWVWEKLGEPEEIDILIDVIEETFGAPESAERKVDVETTIVALFNALSENSATGKCSREEIERAFQFSLFSETPKLRAAIGIASTSAELERRSELGGLPKRLRKDEDEINSIKFQLNEVTKRLERLDSTIDGWPVQRAGLNSALDDLKTAVERRLEQIEARDKVKKTLAPDKSEDKTEAKIRSLEKSVGELSEKAASFDAAVAEVAREWDRRANARIDDLDRQIQTKDQQHFIEVTAQIKTLQERLDKSDGVAPASATDPAILERLSEIEEVLTGNARPAEISYEPKDLPHSKQNLDPASVRVEAITQENQAAPSSATSFAEVAALLALMFQGMGLKVSASKLLADDVCAALFVGQIVFFKGAYATEAARSCANILCAGNAYRATLPVGLQYGEQLRRSLEREIVVDDESVAAITIEGVNLAAFEILKDVLADLVNRGHRNNAARFGTTVVFGTITQGVASLPIDPSYLELGPIIDLDCLDWRSSRPVMGEVKSVSLSAELARSLRAGLAGKSTDIEEAQRLVRSFISKRNPRIEHVVLSAYTALVACRKDKEMPTPLQSLVYGWLVPFWTAHGVAKSEIDLEVDGGKCDANSPDPRIKVLLDDLSPEQLPGRQL
jgi:hypothetical protein